jgi:hypothetical protein
MMLSPTFRPTVNSELIIVEIILTDVAMPSDRHVIQKESEKKLKYKN